MRIARTVRSTIFVEKCRSKEYRVHHPPLTSRKNYRLYFLRPGKTGTTLEVNGVDVPSLEYSFKPGERPISIFCLKADFSDSSGTHIPVRCVLE
ncbi:hypothetical protein NXW13_00680 [Bacteroides thetaiotaomicron]|nr:hypothetical protein [Bacteroides thetaiotaomicron]